MGDLYVVEVGDGEMDWIKCSEKLPEEDENFKDRKTIDVLVTTQYKRVKKVQRFYNDSRKEWRWAYRASSPIAWMYMPEPYKGD